MCTVSWFSGPGGFELFVNRDELRSRPPARPPVPAERDGARYLAPEDTAAGGTWVTVNELGLALSLLNREWPDAVDAGDGAERHSTSRFTSRGALVRALAGADSLDSVTASLAASDLAPYQPFTLLALAPGVAPRLAWWDGLALTVSPSPPMPPLASSSPQPDVLAVRRALWRETAAAAAAGDDPRRRRTAALAFHRSHRPARGASSPCMHRPEARTVSLCHVRVDADRVSMAYAAGPPCRHRLGAPSTLARRGVRATV